MQITISTEEYIKLQESASAKEVELAMAHRELERRHMQEGGEAPADSMCISLKWENVCRVLGELKGNPSLVSFLCLSLLKMMPEGTPSQTVNRMLAAASLESMPLNITAAGDMNVLGTYNNVSGNTNVNF